MPVEPADHFRGVHAATICPMHADGRIDEEALATHVRDVSHADGMTGLLINGHAGENFMLDRAEKQRVLTIARQACRPGTLLTCGIHAEDSNEAQRHVDDAAAAGADAVLIFPPFSWAVSQDDAVALRHHQLANANSSLPMFIYQAGVRSGALAYTPSVLARLVQLPNVVAVKEGSWETATYDANRRLVAQVAPHVLMMASGDEHLFTCFAIGTAGSQVSLACVVPEHVVGLYRAVEAGDLARARHWHERLYPLARAVYGQAPGGHATARLKTCLKLLGRLTHDTTRAPMGPLPTSEVVMLEQSLRAAGL